MNINSHQTTFTGKLTYTFRTFGRKQDAQVRQICRNININHGLNVYDPVWYEYQPYKNNPASVSFTFPKIMDEAMCKRLLGILKDKCFDLHTELNKSELIKQLEDLGIKFEDTVK